MAEVLIRDLDPEVLDRLKKRASRQGRSLQAELKTILEAASRSDIIEARAIAARIRRKLGEKKAGDSSAVLADERRR